MRDEEYLQVAIEQAHVGRSEGGIPIGAALVVDDRVLAAGRNRRVQEGSAIHHGETNALELAGRQPAEVYARATMYTTLSPCHMCAGAILLYGIPRVVIGENRTFMGAEDLLRSHGVEVVVLDSPECVSMMEQFIAECPSLWNEDIGEPDDGPDGFVVPTIDLGGWASGDPATCVAIARRLDLACRTVGFMQVVGHGIPQDVIDGLTDALDEFFGLPLETKRQYRSPRPSINRGYSEPGSEKLSYSLGVDSPADMFEAFNVGSSASAFPDLDLDPDVYAADIWPTETVGFRAGVTTWFEHASALARTMTSVFARALGLPDGFFTSFTDHSIDVLRLVNYALPPGTTLEPDQLGMGAHTDYGIVTILYADPVPGLQVLDREGVWHPVVPAPGALLVNLGDLLARWTNDRWLSTMHRVVPPSDADGRSLRRRSAAFFHDGNADALISTLDPCRGAGPGYGDVTVAEHLAQKLAGSRGLELNDQAHREASRIGRTGP